MGGEEGEVLEVELGEVLGGAGSEGRAGGAVTDEAEEGGAAEGEGEGLLHTQQLSEDTQRGL